MSGEAFLFWHQIGSKLLQEEITNENAVWKKLRPIFSSRAVSMWITFHGAVWVFQTLPNKWQRYSDDTNCFKTINPVKSINLSTGDVWDIRLRGVSQGKQIPQTQAWARFEPTTRRFAVQNYSHCTIGMPFQNNISFQCKESKIHEINSTVKAIDTHSHTHTHTHPVLPYNLRELRTPSSHPPPLTGACINLKEKKEIINNLKAEIRSVAISLQIYRI